MSFLNNIKKILFEEEDEDLMPPKYDEEETKEPVKEEVKEVKPVTESRVKINRDLEFDDSDIFDDIPVKKVTQPDPEEVKVRQVDTSNLPKKEDSIFPGFDEAEFNKLNSRIERNEQKNREVTRREIETPRRVPNNFSSTNTFEKKEEPKKFKPSPVLSPVFGVLNVNYTKEDIIDKKDGIKRETLKPIKKAPLKKVPKEIKEDMPIEVDIDSVRKKAYGELEDLEKTLLEETNKNVKVEDILNKDFTSVDYNKEEIEEETPILDKEEEIIEPIIEETPVEETVEDLIEEPTEEELQPRLLDDLEKTSTLQILDDIEKELNSIKPIEKEEIEEEIIPESEPSIEKSDTLENDLFNLIDSMYTDEEDKND